MLYTYLQMMELQITLQLHHHKNKKKQNKKTFMYLKKQNTAITMT